MGVLSRTQFSALPYALLTIWLTLATLMTASSAGPMEDTETAGRSAPNHLSRLHEDAQQGSPLAQYLLGAFYQLGEAIPQDYAKAAKWYERAADQGLAVAQFALGELYTRGDDVPEDVVRAHMWLSLSVAHVAQIAGAQKLVREAQELRDKVVQSRHDQHRLGQHPLRRRHILDQLDQTVAVDDLSGRDRDMLSNTETFRPNGELP
jgi:hypothetical protein